MTALLDGHHKTLAAALENRDINALVIIPAHLYWKGIPGTEGYTPALSAGELSFYFEDLNIGKKEVRKFSKENPWSTRVTEAEMYDIRKRVIKNNQVHELPVPADGIAERYPDVREQAYIDSMGVIPDELLEDILQKIRAKDFYNSLALVLWVPILSRSPPAVHGLSLSGVRKTFSIGLPLASSSTSLSK